MVDSRGQCQPGLVPAVPCHVNQRNEEAILKLRDYRRCSNGPLHKTGGRLTLGAHQCCSNSPWPRHLGGESRPRAMITPGA